MNPSKRDNPVESSSASATDEILLVGFGDVSLDALSAEQHARLADDPALQSDLNETRELAAALGDALRVTPLPDGLSRRIAAGLDDLTAKPKATRNVRLVHGAWAAAACLIAGLLLPVERIGVPAIEERWVSAGIIRSADDANEIIAAFASLEWDDPTRYTLDQMSDAIEQMHQSIKGSGSQTGSLPWRASEAWDMPASSDNGTSMRAAETLKAWAGTGVNDVVRMTFAALQRTG